MATRNIASKSAAPLTLKQKADAIRAAKRAHLPAERQDAAFGERVGFAAGDFMNGFGIMRDAYTVRRAERE